MVSVSSITSLLLRTLDQDLQVYCSVCPKGYYPDRQFYTEMVYLSVAVYLGHRSRRSERSKIDLIACDTQLVAHGPQVPPQVAVDRNAALPD
jgi:hypothetical protein